MICECDKCTKTREDELKIARQKWSDGERKIVFHEYYYRCGDGCCDGWQTNMYINGVFVGYGCDDYNKIMNIMEFLEYDNVDIQFESEDD